jgi:uncharacterized membrane protein
LSQLFCYHSHQLGPLGQLGHRVAIPYVCVCVCVCVCVFVVCMCHWKTSTSRRDFKLQNKLLVKKFLDTKGLKKNYLQNLFCYKTSQTKFCLNFFLTNLFCLVAMSIYVCVSVCLSACAIAKHQLPGEF